MKGKYAVVRGQMEVNKTFSVWHETLAEARQEAERLCRKEGKEFVILQAIQACSIETVPVKWEELRCEMP